MKCLLSLADVNQTWNISEHFIRIAYCRDSAVYVL
jgi:hypothetical protein